MRRRLALTLAVWFVGAAAVRIGAVPAERCPPFTVAELRAGATAAVGWLTANQDADGRWVYDYERATGRRLPGYNEVRHGGVAMSLYQAVLAGHTEALASADRGLAYMEANLVRRDGWAAFALPDRDAKLGASALMLASLAYRRLATGDARYDGRMAELGRFFLLQQRGDGSFLNYWRPATGKPVPDVTSLYSTGEAYFGLTLLHNLFPTGGWEEPSRRAADYVSTRRDDAEYGWWGPWADQWAAYALDQSRAWPLSDDDVAYARRLAWRFGFLNRGESQKRAGGLQALIRRHYARGGGFGTVVEGTSSLWRVAVADARLADVRDDLETRVRCAAGIALDRQATASEANEYPEPARVAGAWFHRGRTRMDDQQHMLSGLLRAEVVVTGRDAFPDPKVLR